VVISLGWTNAWRTFVRLRLCGNWP